MKKVVVVAASSATGFAVVLGAHAASGNPHGLAIGAQKPPSAAEGESRNEAPGGLSGSTGAGGAGGGASSGAGGSSGASASGGPGGNAPTTTGTPANAARHAASAVGNSEQYGYGVLSVKVTVEGGRITDLSVASLRTAESYSQMIAQQVIPVLRQEVLQAQGVQVNGISGATYTCEAYLLSAQSALSKLRA